MIEGALLTLRAAAAHTGLSPRALRTAIASGDLPFVRIHPRGRLYLAPADLDGWLARHRRPARRARPRADDGPPVPTPIDALLPPPEARRFS